MAMQQPGLTVLGVAGSLQERSVTRVVVREAISLFNGAGCRTDLLLLDQEPLPLYNPDRAKDLDEVRNLQARVRRADVLLLGTPDYHGSIGGALKNFLDYFWHEFAGKLLVPLVASHEKGLTVMDQLRTVARQCYAWSLPYGLSFADKVDVKEGEIVGESLRQRLKMLVRDARVYGEVLARQRQVDLAGNDLCFMAKHRPATSRP